MKVKRTLVLVVAMAMVLTGSIGVFAEDVITNMDEETFLELRMAQIDEALEEGKITEEEAAQLRAHVEEVAEEGTFGFGPANGAKGEGNATCILGDGSDCGIFRSESAGQRFGNGNGQGLQSRDGTGNGNLVEAEETARGTAAAIRGLVSDAVMVIKVIVYWISEV